MLPIYNPVKVELERDRSLIIPEMAKQPIALVHMPWGAISRGSIALGILKQCAKNIGVETDVHYLNIRFAEKLGFDLYETIADGSALYPEWFFSSALFGPGGLGQIKNSWDDLLSTESGTMIAEELKDLAGGSETICSRIANDLIPEFIDDCLKDDVWSKYRVVGFSVTFAQTLAALLLARHIKDRYPDITIVFGGANVDSVMGFEILRGFHWIDYVVHGEAERSFPTLLNNIFTGRYSEKLPGVSMRRGAELTPGFSDSQMLTDLNDSPVPDYTDYFKEMERANIHKVLRVKLSFESSRGCWWGAKAHCTFCGLNGTTMAFRKKTQSRVYEEILHITNRFRCLTLNAVDNILDMEYFKELLPKLAQADLDLSIFYEVKASLTKQQVQKLSAAGVTKIQPGIESFNTDILRLMRKGVTAIQNVQLLKWCLEYGIDPSWNILYGFPGEHPDQYENLPGIFRLLSHLRPPVGVSRVIFERFSPYHFEKEKFKLTLKPVGLYRMLYPEDSVDYEKLAYYFEGQWEDQHGIPQEYIQPALHIYKEWLGYWKDSKVFFHYEKGPGFLILYDNRPLQSGRELTIRKLHLNDIQSQIYLFCDEIRSLTTIQQMATGILSEEQTGILLGQFVDQGLMFREADRYLSLAVRKRSGKPLSKNGAPE